MQLVKTWTSAALPLNLEDVALDLRLDSDDDLTTLERMIRAAGDFLEKRTGFVINAGTYRAIFNDWYCAFPCAPLEIMRAPFRSLNSISYLSAKDTWTDVSLDDFQTSERGKSFLVTALSTFDPPDLFLCVDSVRVEFDAGVDPDSGDSNLSGDPKPMDADVKTILTMLVGHFYKNRELFDADKVAQIELSAGSLLGSLRQFW